MKKILNRMDTVHVLTFITALLLVPYWFGWFVSPLFNWLKHGEWRIRGGTPRALWLTGLASVVVITVVVVFALRKVKTFHRR